MACDGIQEGTPSQAERVAARFGLAAVPTAQDVVRWETTTRDLYLCGYALSVAARLAALRSFGGVGTVAMARGIALCTLLSPRALQLAAGTLAA